MDILLLRTWITNIGNGFIDKGAREAIRQSFPNSNIIEVSGYPNHAVDTHVMLGGTNKIRSNEESESPSHPLRQNTINIAEMVDVDIAVLPGCVLSKPTMRKYRPTLQKLRNHDVPIVILGGGGETYSPEEVSYVKSVLKEVGVEVLVSRDETTYDIYSGNINNSYSGIDCSLFLNDWYVPPTSEEDFHISTFDKIQEPKINSGERVIRPNHAPFDEPFHTVLKDKFKKILGIKKNLFEDENSFISDRPKDYLFLYSNAQKTLSDRVHACLPTLIYGNEAQFFFEIERANLFDSIPLNGDIMSTPVTLDMEKIKEQKEDEISFFRNSVKRIVD